MSQKSKRSSSSCKEVGNPISVSVMEIVEKQLKDNIRNNAGVQVKQDLKVGICDIMKILRVRIKYGISKASSEKYKYIKFSDILEYAATDIYMYDSFIRHGIDADMLLHYLLNKWGDKATIIRTIKEASVKASVA